MRRQEFTKIYTYCRLGLMASPQLGFLALGVQSKIPCGKVQQGRLKKSLNGQSLFLLHYVDDQATFSEARLILKANSRLAVIIFGRSGGDGVCNASVWVSDSTPVRV